MRRDATRGSIHALFVTSVALLGLVVLALVEPGSPELSARPHPAIESMLSSGAGAPGGPRTLFAGFVTAMLTVLMIGQCLLLGVAPHAKGLRRWIVVGTAAYAAVFAALMWSYLAYSDGGPVETFGGLPTPSAWMMYGVWLFPWVFIVGYVATFRTSYYPPESEARFRELLRAKGER